MAVFDSVWYAEIIERFSPDVDAYEGEQAVVTAMLARAMIASACIIAQSIDGLAKSIKESKESVD